jgi:hypothetical protein
MSDSLDRRAHQARNEKDIFDNRVKYILFWAAFMTAAITIWEKCFHSNAQGSASQQVDSISKPVKNPQPNKAALLSHRRHSHPVDTNTAKITPPPIVNPIQRAYLDNTEFKLMSAIGSIHAQTIKMTVILTTSAANWNLNSAVQSIIDQEGNEYRLVGYSLGAISYSSIVELNTGVPIKCTYTFGGILPNVNEIKLFKFQYYGLGRGSPTPVNFRDIPITWK